MKDEDRGFATGFTDMSVTVCEMNKEMKKKRREKKKSEGKKKKRKRRKRGKMRMMFKWSRKIDKKEYENKFKEIKILKSMGQVKGLSAHNKD